MPEGLKCEFRLKAGTKWEQPCGDPAGTYEVTSMVTITMNLCNQHHTKLIADYGWTVIKVEDQCQSQNS